MCTFSCDDPNKPSDCGGAPCPVDVRFYMVLDSDRDGEIDADDAVDVIRGAAAIANWEWGAGRHGAVILCNNDDDDKASRGDNADTKINGGNDKDEIAPLLIGRVGKDPAPGTMKASLEVAPADAARIRIFDKKDPGATEILGPTKGHKFDFPDLSFDTKEFGMEATRYAGSGFDGLIKITFQVNDPSGSYSQEGVVRVAPWIMPNHRDDAEKVFVVAAPAIAAVRPGVGDIPDNSVFRGRLGKLVKDAGCELVEHSSDDRWMQDCLEFGYSNLPLDKGFRTVMRASRSGDLATFPGTLRAPDLGYTEPAALAPSTTFDSTGNLEVTPPCTSKAGKHYPFGRIYYGGVGRGRPGFPPERFSPVVEEFLQRQYVQKPISVDTSWLTVGHVDEIISFVPAGGGFKLLLASPRLAYEILNKNKKKHGGSKLLTGRRFPHWDPRTGRPSAWRPAEVSIQKFLDVGIAGLPHAGTAELKAFNTNVQKKMDSIRALFENEIGVKVPNDLIEIPILFIPNEDDPTVADALTAGMVNMLVINKRCIVPDPFGPVVGGKDLFQKHVEDNLGPLGLKVHFLDDWHEYHILQGEIHCGTNTLRQPKHAKWWEFQP